MQHRILFLSSWYPNPDNKAFGIFVKRAAEAASLYNKVAVLYVHGQETLQHEMKIEAKEEKGVLDVYVFYKKKKRNPITKFFDYKKYHREGLEYVLKNWGKPDIIQLNIFYPAAIAALYISKIIKVPFIACEHWTGYHPEDGSYGGFLRKYFTKRAAEKAKAIITVSEDLKSRMEKFELKGNYKVIPNVVNTEVFKCAPKLNSEKFRFLHVSSLDPRQKNVEGLIDVFKELNNKINNTELIIIGNSENKEALEKRCGSFLYSSIFFLGQQFDQALADEFNKANSFVLFSNYESTLPVVALESICCGTPVIVSNVGGAHEYMKEELGYLVPPKDHSALLATMQKMIAENMRFNREAISNYGKENFSFNRIGKLLSEVYDEIITRSNTKP